jgi:hypothetical protein
MSLPLVRKRKPSAGGHFHGESFPNCSWGKPGTGPFGVQFRQRGPVVHRRRPNYSFKPTPLRGAA